MVILMTTNLDYHVALYIRLSKEDGERSDESLSVINQKNLLIEYINKNGYILYDVYVDDGYTGTNYNRPAFKRMLADIENNLVNMVITKDLSRLGRDYIDTGKYIEKYFPSKGIRYIAILDGIDTALNTSNNDMAPFKAVINDMYSRDNSKKIRTALRSMQEKGLWVGACPPLGYMKDISNKNHLVINHDEDYIVKKIFNLAISGLTCYQISDTLTREHVPTASMIRNNNRSTYMASTGVWCVKTVKKILTNQLYVGDMVQNRGCRLNYKVRKHIVNSRDEWIVVNNTHDAIIDRNTFNIVQNLLGKCRVRSNKTIYRLLDGLLYCHECKHKMMICKPRKNDGKVYIVCNYYRMYSKQKLCTSHSYNYDKLEKIVLDKIRNILKKYINVNNINKKIMVMSSKEYNDNNRYNCFNNKILMKQKQLDRMYYDKLNNVISDDMYIRISNNIKLEIDNLIIERDKENNTKKIDVNKVMNMVFSDNFLRREIILKLVNRIEIYDNKNIDIYFNFKV